MGKKTEGTIKILSNNIELNELLTNHYLPDTFKQYCLNESQYKWIKISIINNGPLLSIEAEKKIFTSFYTSGKNSGTGIGLASSRKIVELHNGYIYATNLQKSNEVAFIIILPAI